MLTIAKSYKFAVVRYVIILTIIISPAICFADIPTLLGKIDLNAPITAVRVTPDAKLAVVMLQQSAVKPGGIRVIEASNPEKPVLKGFLEISGILALSPDGRHALVLKQLEKEKYNTQTRHEIKNIDLSDFDNPKIKWRREIIARKVTIADDASAYAFSMPSPQKPEKGYPQTWQTVVKWINNDRQDTVVTEVPYTSGEMHISDGAKFLLFSEHRSKFRLFDLRTKKPVLYEQSDTFYYRYGDLLAILESGHIIVRDTRTPRIGIYSPDYGIPRLATFLYNMDDFARKLNYNEKGSELILTTKVRGRIDRIDLKYFEKIFIKDTWQLPPLTYPVAATQSHLFAAGGEQGRQLLIYSFKVSTKPAVNWIALETAHRDVMDRYNQDIHKKIGLPYFAATERLEDAGILLALDAPVEEISNKKAAAILNDYGFLAARRYHSSSQLAEGALRRAIVLDPKRATARLNLGDMLRARLSSVTDFPAKQKLLSEIKNLYQQYLSLGGNSNKIIGSIIKEAPDRIAANNICLAIASYANAGRLDELISHSSFNIKVGEHNLDFVFTTEGTAHVPNMSVFDATTDYTAVGIDIETPGGDNLWGGDNLGLVVYGNATHVLHYRDLRHPVETRAIGGNDSCRFETKTTEMMGQKALEPKLCSLLIDDEGPSSIEFSESAPIEQELVGKRHSQTRANNMLSIDFANDGKPVNIAEMILESGAGAGCDARFYDILNKEGDDFASGPKRDLLMKLQAADQSPHSRYPIQCFNKPRFFKYKGKVYFENKPATWPPTDDWHQYHRVARINKGKVADVCDFKFESTVILAP